MSPRTRRLSGWVLSASLGLVTGCRTPCPGSAPAPAVEPAKSHGSMRLSTGAIQLGPGTTKNLWGWQWDGLGGFFPTPSPSPPQAYPQEEGEETGSSSRSSGGMFGRPSGGFPSSAGFSMSP